MQAAFFSPTLDSCIAIFVQKLRSLLRRAFARQQLLDLRIEGLTHLYPVGIVSCNTHSRIRIIYIALQSSQLLGVLLDNPLAAGNTAAGIIDKVTFINIFYEGLRRRQLLRITVVKNSE